MVKIYELRINSGMLIDTEMGSEVLVEGSYILVDGFVKFLVCMRVQTVNLEQILTYQRRNNGLINCFSLGIESITFDFRSKKGKSSSENITSLDIEMVLFSKSMHLYSF